MIQLMTELSTNFILIICFLSITEIQNQNLDHD